MATKLAIGLFTVLAFSSPGWGQEDRIEPTQGNNSAVDFGNPRSATQSGVQQKQQQNEDEAKRKEREKKRQELLEQMRQQNGR